MADLGNLFFGLRLEDLSKEDLNKIISNVQTRLENNKFKLNIDFDQNVVNDVVKKVERARSELVSKTSKKNQIIDVPFTFDEEKALAQTETIMRTYRNMFDHINEEEMKYEQEKKERGKKLKKMEREMYYASAADRRKADADKTADSYYKKLKREARGLGRELDSIYIDRKVGLIGGEKTEKAIKLLRDRLGELYKAQDEYKRKGTFDRGLWDRMKEGDFRDSVKQARMMIQAESKLNQKKQRDAQIDAKINADIEKERARLQKEDERSINKQAIAIQKQQALKQRVQDEERKLDAKISDDIEKERARLQKEDEKNLNRQAMFIQKQQLLKQKAQDEERKLEERISKDVEKERIRLQKEDEKSLNKQSIAIQKQQVLKQKVQDEERKLNAKIEKEYHKDGIDADNKRDKLEKEYLKSLEREAYILSDIQAKKQKALEYEKQQAEKQRKKEAASRRRSESEKRRRDNIMNASFKNHLLRGSVYESVEYENNMNQMRAFYKEEMRLANKRHKNYEARKKQKEKDARTDAIILAQLENEERRVQKLHDAEIERQSRAIQKQQVMKQRALDYERRQKEAQARREKNESDRREAREQKSQERLNLSNEAKKAKELARIASEVHRYENEISKLNIWKKTGSLGGANIDKAIKQLDEYKNKLKEALSLNDNKRGMELMKDNGSKAVLDQARRLVQEQRIINKQNEDARKKNILLQRDAAKLNNTLDSQSHLLNQLGNQIMSVYSIYAIERFARSVIEIGGEFQKQKIALTAMLKDASRADKLFGQVKELAIESPFNFRDLMGFTKQISAFGIPFEEMYDTTKRLADISAGLGVDMGRIILAYGQVRSAAVLRGQELRQFTEAGIPLVDELAKKFTELEGRVVSAGEVFEKISRREVSFGMVKDILWQMTNEGGMFHNMQEVLTESLAGKFAKLQDSWEMMLASIAEGNNGILGGTLDIVTKLTEQWETFWHILQPLITAFGVYKAVLMAAIPIKAAYIALQVKSTQATMAATIANMENAASLTVCNKGAIKLLKSLVAFKALGLTGKIGLILGALAGIGVLIYEITSKTDSLKDKLDDLAESTQKEIDGSVAGYKMLVNKLSKLKDTYGETAEQTKEYADIVKQINSSYGQYLGNLLSEAEAYDNVASSVKRVTAAIEEKKRNEQYQNSLNIVDEEYSSLLEDAKKDLEERISHVYGLKPIDSRKFASEIIKLLSENVSIDEATKIVSDMFNKPYEVFGKKVIAGKEVITNPLDVWIENYQKLLKDRDAAYENALSYFDSKPLQKLLDEIDNSFKGEYDKAGNDSKKRRSIDIRRYEAYLKLYRDKGLGNSDYARKLESDIASLKKWGDSWVEIADRVRDEVYADNKRNAKGEIVENFLSSILPSPEDVEKGMLSPYIDKLGESWDFIAQELDKYEKRESDALTMGDRTDIARLKDMKQYIISFLKAVGLSTSIFDKQKKTGSSKDQYLEDLKEKLRLLKEAHSEYKKWTEIVGHIEAAKIVKDKGIFSMLFTGNEPVNLDDYQSEVEKIRNKIADYIQKGSNKDRREAYADAVRLVLDIEYDTNKDDLERTIKQAEDIVKENLEKWNLFNSIREKTGSAAFAKTLAYGDLNVGENDYMKFLREKAEELLNGKNQTFSSLLELDEKTLKEEGFAALVPYVEAYKDAQNELRKSTSDSLTELIVQYKKYASQIEEIERKKNEDIQSINNNGYKLKASGYDVDKLIQERNNRAEKEKFALQFEQFKESSDWVKIFDDLDRVSTATLENMIKELERFITIAPQGAEEVKAIVEALKNARNEVISRNPFKAMHEAFQSKKNWKQIEKLIKKNGGNPITLKRDQYGFKKGDKISQEDADNGEEDADNKIKISSQNIIESFDAVSNAANYLGNVFEDLGLGSGLADFAGVLGKGASGASSMHGLLSSFGITGPWGAAAGAALGITQGLFALHDKKRDALIEKSQQKVENLKSAYEHLEDSISRGVSSLSHSLHYYEKLQSQVEKFGSKLSDSYSKPFESLKDGGRSYIQSLKNNLKLDPQKTFAYNVHEYLTKLDGFKEALADAIKVGIGSNDLKSDVVKQKQAQYIALLEQRREMQEQLRLEEDKKKKDKSKINDLHSQINELNIQIGTFIEDLAKELFNIDFEAWGQRISDAILDAFAKGEDAAEAFKNVTNDILKDVASGILKNTIITPMFSKLQKKLFGENGEGGMFSGFQNIEDKIPQMSEAIKKFFESEGKEMIEGAQAFLEAFDKATGGSITSDKDSGSSSGLSHGIAGVTEQTADLLASYINAIRADVSVIRALKERYYNSEIPQISAIAQAQLSELNKIAVNTNRNAQFAEDIYNLLHKNVIPGKGFKIG